MTAQQKSVSYLQRLRVDLADLEVEFMTVLDLSTIRYVNPNSSGSDFVFLGAADWGWGPDTDATTKLVMALTPRYLDWYERFKLLLAHPTPQIDAERAGADVLLRRWLGRNDEFDHDIPRTVDAAKTKAGEQFEVYRRLLDLVESGEDNTERLVPDTNALINKPDLRAYEDLLVDPAGEIILLPTVLGELDELKDRGRTPDLRQKAQAVVRNIMGLVNRGPLHSGVTVTKKLQAVAPPREVDPKSVFDWLDPAVQDDRILASALRLQSERPSSVVTLVTDDINLRNKAAAVGLPAVSVP